jgi:hypothetical protein
MIIVELTGDAYLPSYLEFETEEQALAFISRLEYCIGRIVDNKGEVK